jgi:hypothetical protein
MADFTGDGNLDLIYIKTTNTGTGEVEIHVASGASKYQQRIFESGTTFVSEDNGTWLMADFDGDGRLDLIYIKTRNTGTNSVEVHVASGASNYRQRIFESGTTFAEEDYGFWTMADTTGSGKLDLVYIKTSQTGTGKTEVHVASGESNFKQRILETGTVFGPEAHGRFLLAPYCGRSTTGHVEQDLVYIKTSETGTGTVEVHVASAESVYSQFVLQTGTTFLPETDGTWLVADFSHGKIPDLIFIKTANTGTNTVEVHVAAP